MDRGTFMQISEQICICGPRACAIQGYELGARIGKDHKGLGGAL